LFESESSISLDISDFNNLDQAKKIESMLKDYVAAQEALIELADKLKAIKNETISIDCQ
jgi:hypothetical protein